MNWFEGKRPLDLTRPPSLFWVISMGWKSGFIKGRCMEGVGLRRLMPFGIGCFDLATFGV
jgi:hypothetical protein